MSECSGDALCADPVVLNCAEIKFSTIVLFYCYLVMSVTVRNRILVLTHLSYGEIQALKTQ